MPAPEPPPLVARHLKQVLPLAHSKARLELAVSQELFSSATIDVGTGLLLRLLAEQPRIRELGRVLDVGCGYGPIGLLLAAWNPDAEVHCVDRDALAVAFTAYNAERNHLPHVRAYPSLGYDDVPDGGFDLITSNIPAKAGPAVIRALVADAAHRLAPGGTAAVVGIDRIAPDIADVLAGPDFEVLATRTGRGYSCFVYRATLPATPTGAPPLPGFERGDYDRDTVAVTLAHHRVRLRTVWGLPEFDTVAHPTALAAAMIADRAAGFSAPVVAAPGQGHLPVLLAGLGADRVTLIDRDLLALRAARRNLLAAGIPADAVRTVLTPDAEPVDDAGSAVVVLRDPQAQVTNAELTRTLAAAVRGLVVVTGGSTAVTRALDAAGLDPVARRRKAGASAALAVSR